MGRDTKTPLLIPGLMRALVRLESKTPWLHHRRALVLTAGLLITFAFLILGSAQPRFLNSLGHKLQDLLLCGKPVPEPTGRVVIVDLDEKSLARFGQWPWPRYRVALLVRLLKERGAAGIALDMVFAEPDRTSPVVVKETLKRDLGQETDLEGIPQNLRDNDRILAGALSQSPAALGFVFLFDRERGQKGACFSRPLVWEGPENGEQAPSLPGLFKANDLLCNLPLLARSARAQGFLNAAPDPDGTLRRVPLVMEYQGRLFPNLALAARLAGAGTRQVELIAKGAKGMLLRFGEDEVPLDWRGRILVNYRGGRNSIPYISAVDLFRDKNRTLDLEDKYVLVGTSAGGLAELRATPFDPVTPGVEIQATILDNLIKKDFIARPAFLRYLELGLTALLGLASAWLLVGAGARVCLALFGAAGTIIWLVADWAIKSQGLLVSPLYPYLVMGSNFAVLSLLRFRLEEVRAQQRSRELLSVQDLVMQSMAALAETRDNETGGHILRTQRYLMILGQELARRGRQQDRKTLTKENLDLMVKSAPLHDIGKVGISDFVLLKPGRLTPEEFEEMKRHTYLGKDIIQNAEIRVGSPDNSRFLHFAKEIAYCHHERWDGSGYPRGLQREDIPLSGRLMAVADVYDALVSKRVYKEPFSHLAAVDIIRDGSGSHFDPQVVDAFLRTQEQFLQTALELADSEMEKKALVEPEDKSD